MSDYYFNQDDKGTFRFAQPGVEARTGRSRYFAGVGNNELGGSFGVSTTYRTALRAKAAADGMYDRILEGRDLPPTVSERGTRWDEGDEDDFGNSDRGYDY